jgi:hypothetical protein
MTAPEDTWTPLQEPYAQEVHAQLSAVMAKTFSGRSARDVALERAVQATPAGASPDLIIGTARVFEAYLTEAGSAPSEARPGA